MNDHNSQAKRIDDMVAEIMHRSFQMAKMVDSKIDSPTLVVLSQFAAYVAETELRLERIESYLTKLMEALVETK